MNGQLTRVQVYLDKEDISLLDNLAKKLKVTRSQIIRDATKAVADRYIRTFALIRTGKLKKNPLMELIGIEESKTGRVGLEVDEIYLHD